MKFSDYFFFFLAQVARQRLSAFVKAQQDQIVNLLIDCNGKIIYHLIWYSSKISSHQNTSIDVLSAVVLEFQQYELMELCYIYHKIIEHLNLKIKIHNKN